MVCCGPKVKKKNVSIKNISHVCVSMKKDIGEILEKKSSSILFPLDFHDKVSIPNIINSPDLS